MKKAIIIGLLSSIILSLSAEPVRAKTAVVTNGVARLSGPGSYTLMLASGTEGDLVRIEGLGENDPAVLSLADDDTTIVMRNGPFLRLQQGRDFMLNNTADRIQFIGLPRGVCLETDRMSGGD